MFQPLYQSQHFQCNTVCLRVRCAYHLCLCPSCSQIRGVCGPFPQVHSCSRECDTERFNFPNARNCLDIWFSSTTLMCIHEVYVSLELKTIPCMAQPKVLSSATRDSVSLVSSQIQLSSRGLLQWELKVLVQHPQAENLQAAGPYPSSVFGFNRQAPSWLQRTLVGFQ